MDVIGIDPGQKGSTCYLPERGDIEFRDHAKSSPEELLKFMVESNADLIIIEDVHSLYGMSAKSNFSFGYNLGVITTIAELSGIPIEAVQPKQWQKSIGCTKPSGKKLKKEVSEITKQLYPSADIFGKRGGLLDGRSDSLMIAHYAKHKE